MVSIPEYHYTVVLLFPGYGTERENAEAIVESALDWLNANKEEPGFRFAPPVSASLEIVPDIDTARARIEADDGVALVLMHDLDDDDRDALVRACAERNIGAGYTVDVPRQTGPRAREMKLVLRKRPAHELPAHTLSADTLTGPVDEDEEETGRRVGDVIAVLALGVMTHHWRKTHRGAGEHGASVP